MPIIKSGESFKYHCRYYNFEMVNKDHKDQLQTCLL